MKKPSILLAITLPPPVHGAAMMGGYIKQSKLINDTFDCDFINLQTTKKLSETGKGRISKLFTIMNLYGKIFTALIKKRYDLCYISTTASGAGFYKDTVVVLIMKLFRKKIVHHFQNKGISKAEGWLKRKLNSLILSNTYSILLSPYLYPDIGKYVSEEDVFYCANAGAGLKEKNRTDAINQRSDSNLACRFLYLSNMIVQKGVYVLLEACHKLKTNGAHFECHFVGGWTDITEEDFNTKIEEYGLGRYVFAHGPKYGSEKFDFFLKSDVFVFPTFYHYEAFPLVILEAMQNELPVISTPEGGIRESVIEGKTGFLAPQRNAEELSAKMQLLIDGPDLRLKLGKAGKERFEKHFTLEAFETRMLNILNQVIIK